VHRLHQQPQLATRDRRRSGQVIARQPRQLGPGGDHRRVDQELVDAQLRLLKALAVALAETGMVDDQLVPRPLATAR